MTPKGVDIRNPEKLYIDGAWVDSTGTDRIALVSPNSEEVVSIVAEATAADMDRAVAAARTAFDTGPWPRMAPAERGAMVTRWAQELKKRQEELCAAWTAQVGGLASFAPQMHGGAIATIQFIASLGRDFEFVVRRPSTMVDTALVAYEPVGVAACIAPWNAPFGILSSKVAYALVAGCTVIMKPSPETPLEAYIMAEAADAAGIPAGVINLVCGGREASDHLVNNPGVDKVSFTGSTLAGKRIGEVCAGRIARCTLELGGKSAAIVRDDFPIDAAAAILGNTITVMSGQVCAMLSRAIVHKSRHDELAEAIARVMKGVKIGPSTAPDTQLGPLAMKRQLERVESYVAIGQQDGAQLVTGGQRPAGLNKGYFLEPTLFAHVDNTSRIAQEEIFGPVLALIPAEDEDDAIRIANESQFGLNGSVLTTDHEAAYRIGRQVRAGGFGQNGMRLEFGLPFGGFKQSGVGREGGIEGLSSFLESKTLLLDAMPAQL
ncbi:aldehyde dehydrogenase [Novosphingobium sp. 1949]|uniref:Aldehyde dehydrogenase n=1 Tax=Novosphingobium organovorum TaxID=2930092 RepID=A0ABT0B9P1_9SPHN|nr:aldehyde dehydrogenase [Novosphingobium organovorum]MCJ2181797.1 aldehyde dehydrogenase [Novosphingobium organovorum]